MSIATIPSPAPVGWHENVNDLIGYWAGEGAPSTFGGARTLLNDIASDMGLPEIGTADSKAVKRAKINALISRANETLPEWADLYLDLQNQRYFRSGAPVDTHPQTILYADSSGVFSPYGVDVPPINDRGLLTTVGRTNGVVDNTAAGTDGPSLPPSWNGITATGVTITLEGKGEEDGLPYSDIRFAGTPSNQFQLGFTSGNSNRPDASQGQVWTASVFARLVGGSLDGITSVEVRSVAMDGSAFLDATNADVDLTKPSLGVSRTSATHTMPVDTEKAEMRILFRNDGTPVDFTIRVAGMQLELGPFATDPIITEGSAATRTGNRPRLEGLPDGGRAFVFDMELLEPLNGGASRLALHWTQTTANLSNRFSLGIQSSGFFRLHFSRGGSYIGAGPSGPTATLGRNVVFGVVAPDWIQFGKVGASDSNIVTNYGDLPTDIAVLGFGSGLTSTTDNTYMLSRRFAEYRLNPGDDPADAFAMVKATAQEWAA